MRGWNSRINLCISARCISRPNAVGRAGDGTCSKSRLHPRLQVDADRAHVAHDLARATPRTRSRGSARRAGRRRRKVRRQAGLAGAGRARRERCCPGSTPLPPSIVVEPRDAGGDRARCGAGWSSPSDVIGSTESPARRSGTDTRWSRGGAAVLDDAQAPRRDWSVTRWSRRITQSETYSSMPCRVRVPSPRSPVMTAVTPLSLSQRTGAAARRAGCAWFVQPAEQRLDRVEHDPLGADRIDRVAEPDEQPFEIVFAGLLDLAAVDLDVVDRRLLARATSWSRSNPSERDVLRPGPRRVSSNAHEHAGLAEVRGAARPGTHARAASCRSPAPPQTSVGRPRGKPPPVISSSPRMPVGAFRERLRPADGGFACSLALLSGYEYFEVHSCVI